MNGIDLTPEHGLDLLEQMIRIRRFEEKAAELYSEGKIRGFLHLYIGEEAVAVGVMQALAPDDCVLSTYREHGHALSRGVPAGAIMAEMYGKREGCSRGRGGSMHLFDGKTRFFGGHAIVGGGLPLANGLALADVMSGRDRITACFFGDGAVAEGVFHETMNLARLWNLPVLFVCENNLYAMGTRLERAQSEPDLRRHAESYRITSEVVDGMDVVAVESAARRAVASIREKRAPYFLECRTYRFRAHSMFDPERYRKKEEVEAWKTRDPITTFAAVLRERRFLDEDGLAAIEARVKQEVDGAVDFAERGTWEPIEDLLRDVYAEAEP
jgi:pyruvate dehydrogenase E1 component alpha subunit